MEPRSHTESLLASLLSNPTRGLAESLSVDSQLPFGGLQSQRLE